MHDNGERLNIRDFCSASGLAITGKIYSHKEIHKLTWRLPAGKTVNQIDHVMVNGCTRTSILEKTVIREADLYSDHYFLRTGIRLKLVRAEGKKVAQR